MNEIKDSFPIPSHTPGPWNLTKMHGELGNIYSPNGKKVIVYDEGCFMSPEGMANAFLIASAPELLEALKKIVKISEASDHTDADLNGIESVAHKAISIAEGKA